MQKELADARETARKAEAERTREVSRKEAELEAKRADMSALQAALAEAEEKVRGEGARRLEHSRSVKRIEELEGVTAQKDEELLRTSKDLDARDAEKRYGNVEDRPALARAAASPTGRITLPTAPGGRRFPTARRAGRLCLHAPRQAASAVFEGSGQVARRLMRHSR